MSPDSMITRYRLTHLWPYTTVTRAKATNDLRKDDEVSGKQRCGGIDGRYGLDEIWHQLGRLEVGVCSSSPSRDFHVSGSHGSEEEIPHLVPDRLPKMNDWRVDLAVACDV